jgi:hypothetical protein
MSGPSYSDLALLSKVVYRNDAIIPPGHEVADVRDDPDTGVVASLTLRTDAD